jgi:hypothetical protein
MTPEINAQPKARASVRDQNHAHRQSMSKSDGSVSAPYCEAGVDQQEQDKSLMF